MSIGKLCKRNPLNAFIRSFNNRSRHPWRVRNQFPNLGTKTIARREVGIVRKKGCFYESNEVQSLVQQGFENEKWGCLEFQRVTKPWMYEPGAVRVGFTRQKHCKTLCLLLHLRCEPFLLGQKAGAYDLTSVNDDDECVFGKTVAGIAPVDVGGFICSHHDTCPERSDKVSFDKIQEKVAFSFKGIVHDFTE